MISDSGRDKFRQNGAKARAVHVAKSAQWHREHDEPIIDAYRSGLTLKEAGRLHGVSADAVSRILERRGILARCTRDYPCTERQIESRRANGRRAVATNLAKSRFFRGKAQAKGGEEEARGS